MSSGKVRPLPRTCEPLRERESIGGCTPIIGVTIATYCHSNEIFLIHAASHAINMSAKLAACDPCRFSKLACDHAKPICGRCQKRSPPVICEYRARPFKKQKRQLRSVSSREVRSREQQSSGTLQTQQSASTPPIRQYPNPGYLGNSSHTTIFQTLSPIVQAEVSLQVATASAATSRTPSVDDDQFLQAMKLVSDIYQYAPIKPCVSLFQHWTDQSSGNLPLAADFIVACAHSTEAIFGRYGKEDTAAMVQDIFRNSTVQINVAQNFTMDQFVAQFTGANVRWETLGLFLTAVSRASIDVTTLPPHFTSHIQLESLRRLALKCADRCLEISLSLDILNDVQLVLQYENFINHSFVDGDQSYQSWKRLGDVISSIYALGYHENINQRASCPDFLVRLRESIVARAYSADKNVSIFLGRPIRMLRKFCTLQFIDMLSSRTNFDASPPLYYMGWTPDTEFNFALDTWWAFICALLKEEVMDISLEKDLAQKVIKAQ